MKTFAVLIGQSVSNIIVADSIENAELATGLPCIEILDGNFVAVGFQYIDEKFIDTVADEAETL